MLLIGSRAIRHHFPEFRAPRDWDLIGTDADIERLDRVLPRSARHGQRREKAHYTYGGVLVEVANASAVPYWAKVCEAFADEPTIEEPSLGVLRIAPPGFLLLTKQCGLIYRVAHWHKNLEDLYFLRDRIPSIPERVAALLPDALRDSRRMFAGTHLQGARPSEPCHPASRGSLDLLFHRELHERLKLGAVAAAEEPRAWEGFPERTGASRRERMIDLFAEETMVMAAEQRLLPSIDRKAHPEAELTNWALRALITSTMPEGLRYFGVNYYREIAERVPRGWLDRIADLERLRPTCVSPWVEGRRCRTAPFVR